MIVIYILAIIGVLTMFCGLMIALYFSLAKTPEEPQCLFEDCRGDLRQLQDWYLAQHKCEDTEKVSKMLKALDDLWAEYDMANSNSTKNVLEDILPELRESEDERIRKELKEAFEAYDIESRWNGIPIRSIFAWLEKQKEQKPAEWSEEDEEHIKSLLARLEGMCKKGATFTQTRFAVSEDRDWLKSLRPDSYKNCNSRWKPSEEGADHFRETTKKV